MRIYKSQFLIIQQRRNMFLIRKQTLPQKPQNYQTHKTSFSKKRVKVCSQVISSEYDRQIQKTAGAKLITSANRCETAKSKPVKPHHSFFKSQVDKIIKKNKFTLNLLQNSNQLNLLEKDNMKQIKSRLIRQSIFNYYKELNKQNGRYKEALLQAQKQDNKNNKLQINQNFVIKTRKNVFQIDKINRQNYMSKQLSQRIYTQNSIKSNRKTTEKQSLKKHFGQQLRLVRVSRTMNKSKQKWVLKDFWNFLIAQNEGGQQRQNNLKERQRFLKEFNKLNNQCLICENDSNQKQSIQTFSKYNQKIKQYLHKKQRRLSKIKFVNQI